VYLCQQARVYRGGMTPFWMAYEALLCSLMISAVVLLLYFGKRPPSNF